MASVDVDLIPGIWLQISRSGDVLMSNRAAQEALVHLGSAHSWADWLGEGEVVRLPLEWAGLPEGSIWQGELTLRGARVPGPWRGRCVVADGVYSLLLGLTGAGPDAWPIGEFLARFCHDARVPVAAVKSSLFLMDRHGQAVQGEREQKWLGAAGQSVAGLETLVRAVGVLGEWLGPPRVVRPVEAGDARRALQDLVESARVAGSEARIEVAWPREIPARWWVDLRAWSAALEPLLLNALRHAPVGDVIEVRAALAPEGLAIEVSDGGPGVAADEESRLFRPFFRSRHDASHGVGLGLATARAAGRAAGGELTYARRDGRTVFTLRVKAKSALG